MFLKLFGVQNPVLTEAPVGHSAVMAELGWWFSLLAPGSEVGPTGRLDPTPELVGAF